MLRDEDFLLKDMERQRRAEAEAESQRIAGLTDPTATLEDYENLMGGQPITSENKMYSEPPNYSQLFQSETAPEEAPLAPIAPEQPTPKEPAPAQALAPSPKVQKAAQPAPITTPTEATKNTSAQDVSSFIREKYGIKKELGDEAIKAAQEKARAGTFIANMGEAADTFAATLSGNTPRTQFYQRLRESAQRPVQEIEERRAGAKGEAEAIEKGIATETSFEKLAAGKRAIDPTSPESKRARFLIKQLAPEIAKDSEFETMTAAELDDAIKALGMKEQIEARKEMAAGRAEQTKERQEEKKTETFRKEAIRDKQLLDKELNTEMARANTLTGRANILEINIKEARAILDQMKNVPKDQIPQLISGFSQAMARVESAASGAGAAARGTVQEQAIGTLSTDIAKWKQYVTGEATAADISKILPVFDRTLHRAAKVTTGIIHDYFDAVKARKKNDPYAKNNPEEYEELFADLKERHQPIEPVFEENRVPQEGAPVQEIKRRDTKTGKIAVFDSNQKFLRWE